MKTCRFTPRQRAENAHFLRALARTGNAHEAARTVGFSRSRFTKRRAADPAFAARWDAALAMAQSSLSSKASLRTKTGDAAPVLVLRRDGTVQMRRRLATAISPEAETRFLLALAASANVRLAARAAGFASASFYARKRRNPGFAREWAEALAVGYERLQLTLLEGWSVEASEQDAWTHNAPPPVPPMTPNQALQLLHLHQKEARGLAEPPHIRRRRGESPDAHSYRLSQMYEARLARDRAAFDTAERARRDCGEGMPWPGDLPDPCEPTPPAMPDLAQVIGWSRADPTKTPHDAGRALFGGWRIGDWKGTRGEG